MANLSLSIDPARAVAGARTIRRELDGIAGAADKTEGALNDVAEAAGDLGSGLETAGKGARSIKRDLDQVNGAAADVGKAIGGVANATAGLRFDSQGRLRNEAGQYATAIERARFEAQKFGSVANDNFRLAAAGAGIASKAVETLRNAYAGLLAGVSLTALTKMAEQYTSISNVLRVVAGEQGDVNATINQLSGIATRTRTPLEAIATLYQRTSVAAGELGASQSEILRFTENVGLALAQQGGSAAQASGALLQLSQSLGAGVVRAEEFNSMLEGAYPIVLAAAKGIDAAGGSVGRLRNLVLEGKVSSKEFFDAILSQSDALEKAFAGTTSTLGQAFTVLTDNLSVAVGRMNQSMGITSGLSALMLGLADNLDNVAKVALSVGVGIATAFSGAAFAAVQAMTVAVGTHLVAAMNALTTAIARNPLGAITIAITTAVTALTLFRDQIHPIGGEVASLGDYFRATGQIAVEQFGGMATSANEFATSAINSVLGFFGQANQQINLFPTSWDQAWTEIKAVFSAAVQRVIETFAYIPAAGDAARAAFVAAFDRLPEDLKFVAEGAINSMIATINFGLRKVADAIGATPIQIEPLKRTLADAGQSVGEAFSTTLVESQQATVAKINGVLGKIGDGFQTVRERANKIGESRVAAEQLGSGLESVAAKAGGTAAAIDKTAQKAADAFAKQRLSIDETVAALQRQIDTFDASEGAVARVEFRARELAKAWEIAREGGLKAIPAETLSAIEAAAGQIETLTDKLQTMQTVRSAVDEFFPFEKANREAEKLRTLLDDTSLGLSDIERQALALSIDKKFVDAANAAEGLRTRGVKAGQDIGKSFLDNVGDVFADIFSQGVRDGESFFSSILRGFAGLGKQLAAAGGKNLISQLLGLPQDKSAAGIGGLIGGAGSAVGSFSGGAGPAFVPTATPAMRATSSAMAEGVTKAVSGNLLRSVLGAGKSASHIDGLNTKFATALTSMLQAAPEAVRSAVTINSGFRSVARQAELFDAAVKKYGSVSAARKWVAPPGNSQHNVGMAADLGYGSGSVRQWVHANAGKYGLAFPLSNENWHIELAGARGGGSFRSTSSIDESRAQRKAVSDGVVDANRRMTGGQAGDPWNSGGQNLRQVSPGQQGMTGMQRGFGALGAGLGIFGAGYDSGSPLSGGVSGALGGFQAAQALGFAGPIGAIAGGALGILGGILGGRAKRKEAHKAAAAEWEQVRPAYQEFDRSLSGEGTGNLRTMITGLWGQLDAFMEKGGKAWKMGKGNSTAEFAATGTKMFERWAEEIHEFQDGFQYMIEDLTSGQGLQGAFANGRAQVKKLDEQVKNFIDDVQVAFGSNDIGIPTSAEFDAMSERTKADREKRVEEAKRAAGEYALTMLYTAETQTEVEKALDSFKGTAAGLFPILTKLGWSAEEASKAIDERLTAAIDKMRSDFEKDVADRIADLKGEGYLSEVRDFLKEFETLQADAGRLGADTSNFGELFKLQLQGIVDGAELTGTAFDDLIKAFPQLSGVVTAFTEDVAATTAQIQDAYKSFMDQRLTELTSERADAEAKLRSEYERTTNFVAGLADHLDAIKLNADISTLSNEDRLKEAQKQYRDTLALANGGDADAQDKLVSASEAYLREARDYYATSEGYGQVYDEINTTLKSTMAKAESELDLAKRQASFLGEIADSTKGLSGLMKEYLEALKKEQDQQKLVDGGRTFGINTERNRLIDAGLKQVGLNYTGNYGIVNGQDPFLQWRSALPPEQRAVVEGIINQYIGINRASGGAVWGAGTSTSDSIRANLSNGEFVTKTWAAERIGYANMDYMNRTGRLPEVEMPRWSAATNDNSQVVAAIERLIQANERNAKALAQLQADLAAQDRRDRRDVSDDTQRRQESSDRIASRRAQIAA